MIDIVTALAIVIVAALIGAISGPVGHYFATAGYWGSILSGSVCGGALGVGVVVFLVMAR